MTKAENPESGAAGAPFDEFLDRFFRGAPVDPQEFIDTHPALSDEERRQIRTLSSSREDGRDTPGATDALPVTRIATFRLIRKIGAGASGAVYLAEDLSLGRTVAVKVLGPDLLGKGERAERFNREARAVASLRHRNIVTIHAAGEEAGLRYIAMEYLPGSGLDEVLEAAASAGSLPPLANVIKWGIDLANALECAHGHGIVHRDLKPSNIRIAEDGRAVLLDFGIARADDATTLTESGEFRGSPQYASPEQIGVANTEVDARSDVYSLGITLYELLTGAAPFRATTREQLFHQILEREPVAPRRIEPTIPRDLETLLLAMLEKEPGRRPASAALVAADLQAVREGRPITTRRISPLGRLSRWARRQPAKAALAICLAIAIPVVAALGGYIAANKGKIEKAIDLERSARLADALESAFLEYGEGDPVRAVPAFEEALRIDPASEEAKAGLALALINSAQSKRAIAFLEANPPADSASRWREELLFSARTKLRGKKAVAESRSAQPATSIDNFVAGLLVLDQVHEGDSKQAGAAFDYFLGAVLGAPFPTALYHHELGHAAFHAGRHVEARAIADAITRQWPDSPNTPFAVGRTLVDANPKAAWSALAAATRNPPRASGASCFIITHLAESGRSDLQNLSLEFARKELREHPDDPTLHAGLSWLLRLMGDIDGGLAEAREAVRLKPGFWDGRRRLAGLLILKEEYAAALEHARFVARVRPLAPDVWHALGIAEIEAGDLDEGIKAMEKAFELGPRDPLTLCNLGRALNRRGDFAQGIAKLEAGDRMGSKLRGWSYPAQGWIAEAKDSMALEARLEEIRRGDGEEPTAAEQVGIAHRVLLPKRRYAEAIAFFEKGFRDDPGYRLKRSPNYLAAASAAAIASGLGKGVDSPPDQAARDKLLDTGRMWIREKLSTPVAESVATPSAKMLSIARAWLAEPARAATKAAASFLEEDGAGWYVMSYLADNPAAASADSQPASR